MNRFFTIRSGTSQTLGCFIYPLFDDNPLSKLMIVYKKAKTYNQADRVKDFITHKGYGAEIKKNQGFMSDKYPFHVVGNDEDVLGLIDRHDSVVNVVTGEQKRKATWKKPRSKWDDKPKRIRT